MLQPFLIWLSVRTLGLDDDSFLWPLWPPQVSKLPLLLIFFFLPLPHPCKSGQSERLAGSGADQYGPEHHELGGPQGSHRGQRGRTQAQSHPAQPGLLQRLLPHPPVCGWVNRDASTSTTLILFHSLQLILRPDTHWYHSGSPHTHTPNCVMHLFLSSLNLWFFLLFLFFFFSSSDPFLLPSTSSFQH